MKHLYNFLKNLSLLALFAMVFLTPMQVHAVQANTPQSIFDSFELPNKTLVRVQTNLDESNHMLHVTFLNPIFAKKISYELTYMHDGQSEGVVGEFNPRGVWPVQKHITLGTCSGGGGCVHHTNLSDMKLEVTVWYVFFGKIETHTYAVL